MSIAHALERALPSVLPSDGAPVYATFTVGAPLNNDGSMRRRFERALATALCLAGGVGRHPNLGKLTDAFLKAVPKAERWINVPDQEKRVHARSEAHCAILPLRRVFQPLRNFLVADIGATTTDMAVVRIGSEQKPYCYAARSVSVGVDTLDASALAGGPTERDILSLRIERSKRPAAAARTPRGTPPAAKSLESTLNNVLHAAMQKNPDHASWRTLYVVPVGGGSRVPALRDMVLAAQANGWVERWQHPGLALERPRVVGNSTRAPLRDEECELVSVLGSAVPLWEAGAFGTADSVPTVIPTYEKVDTYSERPIARCI